MNNQEMDYATYIATHYRLLAAYAVHAAERCAHYPEPLENYQLVVSDALQGPATESPLLVFQREHRNSIWQYLGIWRNCCWLPTYTPVEQETFVVQLSRLPDQL